MPVNDPPLCLWSPCWKRDSEITGHSGDHIVLHRTAVVLSFSMLSSATKLTTILDAVCRKSGHIHACSSVFLLVNKEYPLPTGLYSLLPPTLIGKLLCTEEICCRGHCNKSVRYHQELPLSPYGGHQRLQHQHFHLIQLLWLSEGHK